MTEPRRSTVYDYSDLRLHPDGTRVYQRSGNLRPTIAKVAVQNSRANWIARDAGGSASIHKFRKKPKDAVQNLEEEEEAPGQQDEEVAEEDVDRQSEDKSEGSSKGVKKRKPKRFDGRKAKRQKFAADYDYLESNASGSGVIEADTGPDSATTSALFPPEPSADLLKCIHRFASEFYTERGQLLNISRQFRKQRKERILRRRTKRKKERRSCSRSRSHSGSSGSEGSSSETESESDSEEEEEEEEEERNEENDLDDSGKDKSRNGATKGKGKKRRKGRRRADKLYVDMYKVFEGSAIMALGMLVQEHIAQLLTAQPPEGWEEEVRNAYEKPWGNEPLHDEDSLEQEEDDEGGNLVDEETSDGTESEPGAGGQDDLAKGGSNQGEDDVADEGAVRVKENVEEEGEKQEADEDEEEDEEEDTHEQNIDDPLHLYHLPGTQRCPDNQPADLDEDDGSDEEDLAPIEYTSDESIRSQDRENSDSEGEFR